MEVKAAAKFIRMSPRKVRLVIDLVRGKKVDESLMALKFLRKDAAEPVGKLIESAAANAEHNFKLKRADLYIKRIMANEGPVLRRWMPRAHGRATPIRKRSCHITVVLDETADQVAPTVKGKKSKHLKTVKSEIRSTKSETNSNDKKSKRLKV